MRARNWFVAFCALHLVIWTLAPALSYRNPPADSLEGVAWGNLWLLGYDKHPFLAPWLTALFTDIFGVVGWPIYLVAQLSIIVCFWAVWRLANAILTPWHALIAVVLLDGINYYNISAPIFNPNVVMLPTWALLTLALYHAVREQHTWQWAVVGLCAGAAMLAKYESAVLFMALFLFLLVNRQARASFRKPGFYLAMAVALVVFAPNLYWLARHNFVSIDYALGNMYEQSTQRLPVPKLIYEPLWFLLEQVGAMLPVLILYAPFFSAKREQSAADRFDRQFLWAVGAGPLLVTLTLALLAGMHLIARWGFPFFSFVSVLWVAAWRPALEQRRLKAFAQVVAGFTAVLAAGLFASSVIAPYVTGRAPHSSAFPGTAVASEVTAEWRAYYGGKLPCVGGDRKLVSNVAAFSSDKPAPFFSASLRESPWLKESDVIRNGCAFVYLDNGRDPERQVMQAIRGRFAGLEHGSVRVFARQTGANVPPVTIWIAYLPPEYHVVRLPRRRSARINRSGLARKPLVRPVG